MFALGEVREPTEADFDHFREFASEKEGWTIFHSKKKPDHEITTSTKCLDCSAIKLIKVEAKTFNVQAASIYDCLHDAEYRKTWDFMMKEGNRIAYVSPNSEIGYYYRNIPTFAVNIATKIMAPKMLKCLLDAARGYSRWKESNNPDFVPWRNFEQLKQFPLVKSDDISNNSDLTEDYFEHYVILGKKGVNANSLLPVDIADNCSE
ncbi:unnamed protein product [Dibothriocephalus latus]|uniref:START domain-containing protein n=1 Tax=Dibothriocephalus latus TaxID=60516 RepID=A0A3P6STX8_DIBLA|nr:unnamed protein product [Dibothriocephalus latus]